MPPDENFPAPRSAPSSDGGTGGSGPRLAAGIYPVLKELLFALDAETAHHVTIRGLRLARDMHLASWLGGRHPHPPGLAVEAMGLRFPNPLGLAAGLDKDGVAIDAFGALGFGFVEIGTVTPRPQPGNPRPRLFRIPSHEAIVNRMGFNNGGVAAAVERARARTFGGILGINIGKNFDTPNERAVDDYLACLRAAAPVADYVAVNLSSPNTKGLRDLQEAAACRDLLARLKQEQAALQAAHPQGKRTPIAIKIAPDVTDDHADALADVFIETGVDAVIATNTTIDRSVVRGRPHADEAGGLSGAPLTERANALVRLLSGRLGGRIPIIGVGGIMTVRDALDRLDAGASLIQLYTGLVYHGPPLVHEILAALVRRGNKPAA